MTSPALPSTVDGLILEPDERVVYFHRDEPGWQKPFLIILGLVTLIAFIGLFFLLIGLTAGTTIYVITNRRFVIIEGRKPKFIRHGEVKQMIKKLKNGALRWIHLIDAKNTVLMWQVVANKKNMPELLERYVDDPTAADRAE